MSEIMYLLRLSDYDAIKPQVREYETALVNAYAGKRHSSPARASDRQQALAVLRDRIRKVAVSSYSVPEEVTTAMRTALRRVKSEEPGTHALLQAIYQAIGAEPDELKLFLTRLAAWPTVGAEPIADIYQRAVSESLALVVLSEDWT